MKPSSFAISLISRLRVKGKLKFILILLFAFSLLFLTYQLIYYTNLTNYQSQENHLRLIPKRGSPFASIGVGGRGGGYRSLKDIAYHLEEDKHTKDDQEIPINSKGDTGALIIEKVINRRGKPIFSGTVLGVAPEAQKYYLKQQQKNKDFFSCFGSGKQITWDKVNDDFCDCPSDGSDEPSTAACMNGRFFCSITKQGFPEYIPSSMVNDGICDCADGSDEHQRMNSISCRNRS